MKRKLIFCILCLIILSASTACIESRDNSKVIFDGISVDVTISDSIMERTLGLMLKDDLSDTEGMLFIFESEGYYDFWMKNMNFPIDIIWISSNFSVIHIEQNCPPCKNDDCPLFSSPKPAKYVLEVKSNFTEKNNISLGDKVILDLSSH